MARSLPEWIGKNDDEQAPPRVRLRVLERDQFKCQCGCGILIGGKPWQTDHTVAIINGGQNRESNLRSILVDHHKDKTAEDVAEKSKSYAVRLKAAGIKKRSRFACAKDKPWRKKVNGEVVPR